MSQEPTNPILDAFAEALRKRDKRPTTVGAYLRDLRQFIAWFQERTGETFTLPAITEYDVQGWRDHLAATLKPASVNRKLTALSIFFQWAIETGQVERNPTRYVNGVDEQPTAPKALSQQDLTRILRKTHQAGELRDIAMLELLAATGLRAEEVTALTIGDVEIKERSGWVMVRAPGAKRRKQRRVPLNAKSRRALREWLETRPGAADDDPLFTPLRGSDEVKRKGIQTFTVWYTVKKYAKQAGLDEVSLHTFRHTVATRLVRSPKVDMVTAATFLGHSRLETTARYSQPTEDDLAAAAEEV